MDEALIWKVLELEPTKDEEQIKTRYQKLLLGVNPEDDPEGFKRLRQAYEGAIELARKSEEEGTKKEGPKDEIDLWLDRIQNIYWYKDTRNDPEVWQEAFRDPVCVALDTALKARERFLVFLMNHNYLKNEVWKVIDKEFNITADRQELLEYFPKDYLDFLCYQIDAEIFFTIDQLEILGPDESEIQIDSYIGAYLQLKAQIDLNEFEDNLWQKLEDLKAYQVYHPYEDVERVRLYLQEKRLEEAAALLPKLEKLANEDPYVGFWTGRIYSDLENDEKAYEYWNRVIEEHPGHYISDLAMLQIIRYNMKRQDYLTAKEQIMDLLELDGNKTEALALMREVNVPLIEYYHNLAEKEPENKEHILEACWCMFQNKMYTETIQELDSLQFNPEDEDYYSYTNMKGRCLLGLEQYEEALPYLLQWEECRKKLIDDGSKKYKRRHAMEGFIMSAIGVAYQKLKKFQEAEAYLKKGIQLEQDTTSRFSFMDQLALLYYDNEQYERCIDTCTEIVEEDPGYYVAYLRRQQAYFNMQNGQGVVDDYYNAIRIFASHYKPYLLAIRVFCIFQQYEDAKKVLEAAKEQGVEHEMLKFYEVRVLRNLARSEEEDRQVMELCQQLKQELEKKKCKQEEAEPEKTEAELIEAEIWRGSMPKDEVDWGELAYEEILIYMNLGDNNTAMKLISTELINGNQDYRLHWTKADIYQMQKEYQKALAIYDLLEKRLPDNANIDFEKGLCLQRIGKAEEAVQAFQATLKKDDKHSRANYELMRIYRQWSNDYERKWAYGLALKYINAQLELVPNAYYYIERGFLYMDNYHVDLALADFHKALKLEPDNIYAYNAVGYALKTKRQFEDAIPYFQKSIEMMREDETMAPYMNLTRCYRALVKPEKGIEVLQQAMEKFPHDFSEYRYLAELYACHGDQIHARQFYEEALQRNLIYKSDYYRNIIKYTYLAFGDLKGAKKLYKQWMNDINASKENEQYVNQKKMELNGEIGCLYFYQRNLKKAIHYLEESWKLAQKSEDIYTDYGRHLAMAYVLSGQRKKAYLLANTIMNETFRQDPILEKWVKQEPEDPESEATYLSYLPRAAAQLYELADLHFCLGDEKRAMEYLDRIGQTPACSHCPFSVCYDAFITRAFWEEANGNIEGAINFYRQALQFNPIDEQVIITLQTLERKTNR